MENMYDILNKFNSVANSPQKLNESKTSAAVAEGSTGDYSAKKARAGKDIGKPGKNFEKIAKSAGEKYGSKERGEKVAGAVLAKLRTKESIEEQQVTELKKSTLGSYAKKASADAVQQTQSADAEAEYGTMAKSDEYERKAEKRLKGVGKAVDRLTREGDMDEGNKFAHNVLKAKAAGMKKADLDGDGDMETVREEPMTPKQKKFAALAAPKDKITFADKIAGAKKEVDEMLGDVAAKAMREAVKGNAMESDDDYEEKPRKTAAGGTVSYHAGGVTRHKAAPGRYGGYNPETDPDKDEYDDKATGEKRGRGRPKGTGKRIGAKGPSGTSKLMSKESAMHESDEIAQAKALLKKAGYTVSKDDKEDLDEKAVSKKQQKFMGMVHAAQKGEKPASKEVAKVAKSMKKSDAEDFAATKHKGLPEKKKKEVEETTTAGSVATAPSTGKAGSMFGKGVYEAKIAESFNKKLDSVLNEGMSVNMSVDADGKKSLSVTATDEDAVALSKLLNLAGIDAGAAGMEPETPVMVGAMEEDLANSPEPHYSDIETMINTLSGGLDGKKSTGQTTAPVVNRDPSRGSIGPVAENKESRLWELYHRYSSK